MSSRAPHGARSLWVSAQSKDQAGWVVASSSFRTSKARPRASTLQTIRASLLASAIASTLWSSRFLAASIQDLSPWRSQTGLDQHNPCRLDEQNA
jgi:hypothetical protein